MTRQEFTEQLKQIDEVTKSGSLRFQEKFQYTGEQFGWIKLGTKFVSLDEALKAYEECYEAEFYAEEV